MVSRRHPTRFDDTRERLVDTIEQLKFQTYFELIKAQMKSLKQSHDSEIDDYKQEFEITIHSQNLLRKIN